MKKKCDNCNHKSVCKHKPEINIIIGHLIAPGFPGLSQDRILLEETIGAVCRFYATNSDYIQPSSVKEVIKWQVKLLENQTIKYL